MTEQRTFLDRLLKLIESAGIPYAVCGSLSSGLHGQPRATNDADIVIAPTPEQLERLLQLLENGYYASPEAAAEALRTRSMFNVIENESGWKADLVLRKDSPYQLSQFGRRMRAVLWGIDIWVLSAEDVVLSKLEWAKESRSEMQFRDVFGVMKVQWNKLDWDYLRYWARQLGVEDDLAKVTQEVKKLLGGS